MPERCAEAMALVARANALIEGNRLSVIEQLGLAGDPSGPLAGAPKHDLDYRDA